MQGITKKVMRQDIYLDAMKDMGVTPKGKGHAAVKFFDGTFDPNQAEKYACLSRYIAAHNRGVQ